MSGELYNEYGDINFDIDSVGDDSYYKSNKKKIYEAMHRDSNFIQVTINRFKKNKKIGCYMAGYTGSTIVNAVTGQKYRDHYVGKFDEDLYFKVMLCSGQNGQNPATLFYDNPQQYEKHFFCELSEQFKNDWLDKFEYQQGIEDRKNKNKIATSVN